MRLYRTCLAALAIAACSPDAPVAEAEAPVPIRAAKATAAGTASMIVVPGTVRLRREAELGFGTGGTIRAIHVDEGDNVRRGAVLAELDLTTVAANLDAAIADKARAAAELKRSRELIAKGWLTRARLEQAEAAYEAAAASADAAGYAARTARIVAPADGTVLGRLGEPGKVVAAGAPVIAFGDRRDGFVLRVPLTDRQASGLVDGAAADVRIAALGDASISARLVEIGGRADAATGTFTAAFELPAHAALRSGQIGEARFRGPAASADAVLVPTAALFAARAGEAFVFVVEPGNARVRARRVAVGATGDDGTLVTSGLRPGELVATTNLPRLHDGASVDARASAQ